MDQVLLRDAEQQDKRQWAGTDALEVPPKYKELYCDGDHALEQIAFQSPPLEKFQSYLDKILCRVLYNGPV
ncbi:hypothetical protein DUI87_14708 [Hirundo rustica rustica]|uniref:Uncharacterized protein n=1 Tax=Hirundo rustica rustica TaxID=333673 RepID=A0A3M0KAY8_HIRRU|nr:hypothetical protein DUI87_14708 [Hirundo rustica rustica]